MKNVSRWMLAAAVVAGGLGLGATNANAAQIGIYVRSGRPSIPPCPGPGYVWVNAYYDSWGNYTPGYWNYVGVAYYEPEAGVYMGYGGGGWDRERRWDHERREHEWREREHREHEWREHEGREHEGHDRGEHRGWDR